MKVYWRLTSLPELNGLEPKEQKRLLREASAWAMGGKDTIRATLVLCLCMFLSTIFGIATKQYLIFALIFVTPGSLYWHSVYTNNIRVILQQNGYPKK